MFKFTFYNIHYRVDSRRISDTFISLKCPMSYLTDLQGTIHRYFQRKRLNSEFWNMNLCTCMWVQEWQSPRVPHNYAITNMKHFELYVTGYRVDLLSKLLWKVVFFPSSIGCHIMKISSNELYTLFGLTNLVVSSDTGMMEANISKIDCLWLVEVISGCQSLCQWCHKLVEFEERQVSVRQVSVHYWSCSWQNLGLKIK